VLTRDLINLLTCAGLIVFVSGFAHAVRRADEAYEWPASVIYGAGMLFTAMALVGVSLETGTVFGAPDGTLDPTVDGLLADGNVLIHGSIKRLLSAIFLLACGYAGSRTRLIPGWLAVAAYLIAAFNLFFVPSLYFGKDATQFYSAIGWGNTAFSARASWCTGCSPSASCGRGALGSGQRARLAGRRPDEAVVTRRLRRGTRTRARRGPFPAA
jgi:hypothetical protein